MNLKNIFYILFLGIVLNTGVLAVSASNVDDQDIFNIMEKHHASGTVVVLSKNGDISYVYNKDRATLRLSPASTFKIPNSIIAVEESILKNQHEVIKWDGKKRFLDAWNKDQNLKSAFKSSCVWCYQKIAKKVEKKRYLKWFKKLNYGNQLLGKDVTTFWLDNSLKITALEQINFLRKLYTKQLPISARTYDVLKDIMLEDSANKYQIYSKTGATSLTNGHGWYVGYVISKNKVWFFATNILINGVKDLPKRKNITIDVLKEKNII